MKEDITPKIQECINEWQLVKGSTEAEILKWETKTLKTIFPHRFENVEIILTDMIQTLLESDTFWSPRSSDPNYSSYFSKTEFNSFMDFFTRELSEQKRTEIIASSNTAKMIIPNECYVESMGEIKDLNTVISLKKSCDDVKGIMKNLGFDLTDYSFINHKLLLTFYHRIHSPVSGVVERIIPYPKEEGVFGDNALWILDINTKTQGHVYFMLVGESEIQDFTFLIKEGQEINIFDEIGNFNWGSQTILFYNTTNFGPTDLVIPTKRFFVGDEVF